MWQTNKKTKFGNNTEGGQAYVVNKRGYQNQFDAVPELDNEQDDDDVTHKSRRRQGASSFMS